ncbi:hypothetical protein AHiyo6_00060 [Arthrobacter sp. Hiyo6]|nr:hypothetical protein AHiyo6_00060 [Arthrobacter sp. Hiyo6]
MVKIQAVTPSSSDIQPHRTESVCTFQTVSGVDGEVLLHIATYGSAERAMPGKASQQIQFTESGARDMLEAIFAAFPTLKRTAH